MLRRCLTCFHIQISIKLILSLLIAAFYVTIIYRESLSAIDQSRGERLHQREFTQKLNNDDDDDEKSVAHLSIGAIIKTPILPGIISRYWTTPVQNTAVSTLNPVYEYSEELHRTTEEQLQLRSNHLQKTCKKYSLYGVYPPRSQEFFISTGHNLIWCNVFKAASSTWMYYFNILGGYDPKYLQNTKKQPLQLARRRFPRPQFHELYESLPNSLSFLFVRDPFERILSAYRDKLEGARNSFYKPLGRRIARRFRSSPVHFAGPTFKEFIKYLIVQHSQNLRPLDEHWAPIYKFCTPCSIPFRIIGKVETFNRDSEFIIRQAGLESLLLGKLPNSILQKVGNLAKGKKTDSLVANYFKEIDHGMLLQLLHIYRLDFELFDYDYSKYFEYIKRNMTSDKLRENQFINKSISINSQSLPITVHTSTVHSS